MFVVRHSLPAVVLATILVGGCAQKSDHEQPVKILKPNQVKITLGNPPASADAPSPAATDSATTSEVKSSDVNPAEPAAPAAAAPETPPPAAANPAEPAADK